jgi:hypothetical protein
VNVSLAALPASRGHELVARFNQVANDELFVRIQYDGPRRDQNGEVLSAAALPIGSTPMSTAFRSPRAALGQRGQAVDTLLGHDNDTPSVSAVTTVRPTFGNVAFAPKAAATVAAVSGRDFNFHAIDKHRTCYSTKQMLCGGETA